MYGPLHSQPASSQPSWALSSLTLSTANKVWINQHQAIAATAICSRLLWDLDVKEASSFFFSSLQIVCEQTVGAKEGWVSISSSTNPYLKLKWDEDQEKKYFPSFFHFLSRLLLPFSSFPYFLIIAVRKGGWKRKADRQISRYWGKQAIVWPLRRGLFLLLQFVKYSIIDQ